MSPVALQEYGVTLELPRALLALEAGYPDPPPAPDAQVVEALRGAAVVLMVGAFERYLRAVVAEHLDRLSGDPPPVNFAGLPVKLRVESVFSGMYHALSGPRYGEPGTKEDRLADVVRAADRVSRGALNVTALSETKGNADSSRLQEMLKSLAIQDPFDAIRPDFEARWGKPEAERFVRDKLDDIVSRRHSVAHKADALNLTRVDLTDALRFMNVLGEVLDGVLTRHVDGIVQANPGP